MRNEFDPTADDVLGFIFAVVAMLMLCIFSIIWG